MLVRAREWLRDRFWALMDEPGPLIEAIEY